MKPAIHPPYHPLAVSCSCGNAFETRSSYEGGPLKLEVCNACHPSSTGKWKIIDAAGKVDQFKRRYGIPDDSAE